MIDIKPPERERNELIVDDLVPKTPPKIVKIVDSRTIRIENELHELNKVLKDILWEMRKRCKGCEMTFSDLYHLNDKCERLEKMLPHKDFEFDEGRIVLKIPSPDYEDLEEILRDCKRLVYDLCQANVRDVIRRDT